MGKVLDNPEKQTHDKMSKNVQKFSENRPNFKAPVEDNFDFFLTFLGKLRTWEIARKVQVPESG